MSGPADHAARARAVSGRDRSLLVEASAGTGKTHAIIEAIVQVCVRRTPRLPLTRVAAVTFTEKAAGELQDRLRRRLALGRRHDQDRPAGVSRQRLRHRSQERADEDAVPA